MLYDNSLCLFKLSKYSALDFIASVGNSYYITFLYLFITDTRMYFTTFSYYFKVFKFGYGLSTLYKLFNISFYGSVNRLLMIVFIRLKTTTSSD
jgi:hypothetical protein